MTTFINNLRFLSFVRLLAVFTSLWFFPFANAEIEPVRVVPQPVEMQQTNSQFTLTSASSIYAVKEAEPVAMLIKDYVRAGSGIELKTRQKGSNQIALLKNEKLPLEAYQLIVNSKGVEIIASGDQGWFYGFQTLKQLFPQDFEFNKSTSLKIRLPGVEINDKPRFSWRAFMLDEARHFKGKHQVKLLLDEMAALKMNRFHWHLVDDQGWRIEIKQYPKLTKVGAYRTNSQVGPLKWKSNIRSGEPHSGFYTQDEIKELVAYAKSKRITIIPEIGMLGHSTAAVAAYPWLGTYKKPIDMPTKFGPGPEVFDVTDPRVLEFAQNVLTEVIELFPSDIIHIGGDEVKYKHWNKSKHIQDYIKRHKLAGPADLQIHFTNKISKFLSSKGKRMMGWNDILGKKIHHYHNDSDNKTSVKLAGDTLVHFWKGDVKLATEAATKGYDIINSLHTHTYLDYDYKRIPLDKAYSFDPIPKGLAKKHHDRVIGTGTQMWGEWIPTIGQMHYMVFPRIAAYAEIGWTESNNKNFDSFLNGLTRLQQKWEKKGINFAPNQDVLAKAK